MARSIPVSASTSTRTNRSGTITTGGAAQNLMPANASRKYLLLQNPSTATESLWFTELGVDAVQAPPSMELQPGQSYESALDVPVTAISIIAATTGHAFTARES